MLSVGAGHSQSAVSRTPEPESRLAGVNLPDAPSPISSLADATVDDTQAPSTIGTPPQQVADRLATTIQPGQSAQPLTANDKLQIGVRKELRLGALASALVSAEFGNVMDSRPHYGVDSGAFGQRLGAAAIRQTSQSVFFYGVYSNLFQEDPRYYVMGSQHSFRSRVIYAASRVFITRKDGGRNTPNWALFAAVASSSALTNAYYPDQDRSVRRSVTGTLTSLAVRVGTQQLREFSGEIRQRLHLKRW